MITFARQMLIVAAKDLRLEVRSRERILSMLTFAVLVAVVFSFAVDPVVPARGIAGAMLWVTVIFAGLLGLGRSFSLEREQDALTGMLLAPVDRGALFLGKATANLVLLFLTEAVVFPVFALFFQLTYLGQLAGLIAVVGLASIGFVVLGTLFSAMTASTRLGDTMLPILLLPLLIPVVIYAASSTQRLIIGRPLAEVSGSLRMLLAFDVVFIVVATLLFSSVVEE